MSTTITCPKCRREHGAPVQLTAETSSRAAKRPVTPEVIHLCPHCGVLLILSLHPALRETSAS